MPRDLSSNRSRRSRRGALMLLAVFLGLVSLPAQDEPTKVASLRLADGQSRHVDVFPSPKGALTVLMFIKPGCPVTDSYSAAWNELARSFADNEVRFFQIAVDVPEVTGLATHAAAFGIDTPILIDRRGRAAQALSVGNTAECLVVDDRQSIRYRGRFDDRWASRTEKREPRTADLAAAIAALLKGEAVAQPVTRSFGCIIDRPDEERHHETPFTWTRDVAPILQRHCQQCHRKGEVAPFPLTTYEETRRFAHDIVAVTHAGFMPPWKSTGPRDRFVGDRRLSDAEKATLASWTQGGM
ncbi:MAG: redoxin domain-containing protein, partial [Planctomycetes bacterium]|nr:redoxin domain-containing protein [Planctomycetota bacterium]